MSYIEEIFHFYETTQAFETHRKLGLISPDSICFLKETRQIYTQNTLYGICEDRFEKLEQMILVHEAKINNILGITGSSVDDGVINNVTDIFDFLHGFAEGDNLQNYIKSIEESLIAQITSVNNILSDRIVTLSGEIDNMSASLEQSITTITGRIDTIDTKLADHKLAIDTIITNLDSHVRDYEILKANYNNFKTYVETRFDGVGTSISALNSSISTLQESFVDLNNKFANVEKRVQNVTILLEEAKQLIKQLNDRFDETLADIEQFKVDIHAEITEITDSIGAANGIAPLDGNSKVPAAYLPSYVDDVLEFATVDNFPTEGESGKIYVALDTNLQYRWSGTQYTELSKSLALGETSSTAYPGDKGKKNADDIAAHKADTNNPHNVTKAQVGLGNVNNTSDEDKPVSTAQATAINAVQDDLTGHKGNKSNPHDVTKAQVGLGNVDNTSDADKPVSTATQNAIDSVNSALAVHINDQTNPHNVTKSQVGLGNVDNTADMDKPVSTAMQTALTALSNEINTLRTQIQELLEWKESQTTPQ